MNWSQRELKRQPDDAMVAGVCSGLAHYSELDVALVRAAFIVSTIFGGFGLAAYLALWVLVDPDVFIAEPPPVESEPPLQAEDLIDLAQNPAPADVS